MKRARELSTRQYGHTSTENTLGNDFPGFVNAPGQRQSRVPTAVIANWISSIDHKKMHDFSSSQRYLHTGIWLSYKREFCEGRDRSASNVFG
jgi:hypothetical protein